MKRVFWMFMGAALAGVLVLFWTQLSESKKRYILHLLRQVPYLPGRYMV